ncbi:MAG: rod-binding protein [Pararhodobacter sp.]
MTNVTTAPPAVFMRPGLTEHTTSVRRSAEALETAFLAEMLKSAGIGGAATARNEAEQPFASFMADSYAESLMARGGIGLATHIERALALRQPGAGE